MIVRVWRAYAKPENAPAYRQHLKTHIFPTLKSIDGFAGADLLERPVGSEIEFVVLTRWATLRAVRAFAGDTYENAVVAPAARAALSSFEEQVAHFEMTAECKP